MEKVRNGEELRQRLVQAAGEDIAAFGWGTLGMKNVFVGVTPSAVVLEFITMGMKTKELRRIPFEELDFIYAFSGDASTPRLMKLNLEARITEAMTGTLVLKTPADRIMNITFRKMPLHERNDRAPFRITEYITSIHPEKVHLPDLKARREKQPFGGCMKYFIMITGISTGIILLVLGLASGKWDMAFFAGLGTGAVLGAVFAPLIPVFKRMLTGRG